MCGGFQTAPGVLFKLACGADGVRAIVWRRIACAACTAINRVRTVCFALSHCRDDVKRVVDDFSVAEKTVCSVQNCRPVFRRRRRRRRTNVPTCVRRPRRIYNYRELHCCACVRHNFAASCSVRHAVRAGSFENGGCGGCMNERRRRAMVTATGGAWYLLACALRVLSNRLTLADAVAEAAAAAVTQSTQPTPANRFAKAKATFQRVFFCAPSLSHCRNTQSISACVRLCVCVSNFNPRRHYVYRIMQYTDAKMGAHARTRAPEQKGYFSQAAPLCWCAPER